VTRRGSHAARPSRFRTVAALIPRGSRVADIGTDHGRLPRLLRASGIAAACIATERDRLPRFPVAVGGIELRRGHGLAPLRPDDRVDVLVLTGMGSRTVLRILERPALDRLGIRRIVCQPQTDWPMLRRGLTERRLEIVDERLIRERGRYYLILAAEPREDPVLYRHPRLDHEQLLDAGPALARSQDPVVFDFWRAQADRLAGIVRHASPGAARDRATRQLACIPDGALRSLV